MRILIVSFQFPPFKGAGCLRVGKTAKYLIEFGHDVQVLSARDQNVPFPTLPVEIDPERVHYTRWLDTMSLLWRRVPSAPPTATVQDSAAVGGDAVVAKPVLDAARAVAQGMRRTARSVLHCPDREIGWYPFAVAGGDRIIRSWRPDLLYASAFPPTSLLVAAKLSRRHGIPWVAEMRDLWSEFYYYTFPEWRRRIDAWLERRVLSTAAGIVTVSDPLADRLREQYGKPTEVVHHGFEPDDYPALPEMGPRREHLEVVYTGNIYDGAQDPAPLFEAMRLLGERGKRIRVSFYGYPHAWVLQCARDHGVEERVELKGVVSHEEALRAQAEADALLVLLWNAQDTPGVYLTKSLEYFGARRPILGVGSTQNGAAMLILDRGAGAVGETATEVAEALDGWLRQKEQLGAIPPLPESVGKGLSRRDQTHRLDVFLRGLMGS